jgi:hypothetical protein
MAMQYAVPLFYLALGFASLAQIITYALSDRSRWRKVGLACALGAVIVGAVATKLTSNHLENLVHFLVSIEPAAAGKLNP